MASAVLRWLFGFIRDELLSAAFWKVFGVPTVLGAAATALALLNHYAAVWVLMFGIAAFAGGTLGVSGVYRTRFFRDARAAIFAVHKPTMATVRAACGARRGTSYLC